MATIVKTGGSKETGSITPIEIFSTSIRSPMTESPFIEELTDNLLEVKILLVPFIYTNNLRII